MYNAQPQSLDMNPPCFLPQKTPHQQKKIGNYSFFTSSMLGEGSFSQVFLGKNDITGEEVAIKVINMNSLMKNQLTYQMLLREIQILKTLEHPNIVRCFDVFQTNNNTYIITEFCDGGDLETRIQKSGGSLPEHHARRILKDILFGLKELLRIGIVHRDLKPANIFIKDNVHKLGDFGFAKIVGDIDESLLTSQLGTPLYMSPQMLNNDNYTSKSDIWSLGIIYYELLYGCTPWPCRNHMELLKNIYVKPIIFPAHVPVSDVSRDFIGKTLQVDEKIRITWDNIYEHPIFKEAGFEEIPIYSTPSQRIIVEERYQQNFQQPMSIETYFPPEALKPKLMPLTENPNFINTNYFIPQPNPTFTSPNLNQYRSEPKQRKSSSYLQKCIDHYVNGGKQAVQNQARLYSQENPTIGFQRTTSLPSNISNIDQLVENYKNQLTNLYLQDTMIRNDLIIKAIFNFAEFLKRIRKDGEQIPFFMTFPLHSFEKMSFLAAKHMLILTQILKAILVEKKNVLSMEIDWAQIPKQFQSLIPKAEGLFTEANNMLQSLFNRYTEKGIGIISTDESFLEMFDLKGEETPNLYRNLQKHLKVCIKEIIGFVDDRKKTLGIKASVKEDDFLILYLFYLVSYEEMLRVFVCKGRKLSEYYELSNIANFDFVASYANRSSQELQELYVTLRNSIV